jgi:O-antigen ligase
MNQRVLFVFAFLLLLISFPLLLPKAFVLSDYLFRGGQRVYVVLPIMAAFALGISVLFLFLRNRHFELVYYFAISLPLISILHRRLELNIRGTHIYLETLVILALFVLALLQKKRLIAHVGRVGYILFLLIAVSLISSLLNSGLSLEYVWFTIQEHLLPFLMFFIVISFVTTHRRLESMSGALLYSMLLFSMLSLIWVFVLGQTVGMDTGEVLTAQTRINSGFRRLLVGAGFTSANVGNRLFLLALPLAIATVRGKILSRRNIPNLVAIAFSLYFVIASEHRTALMANFVILFLYLLFGKARHIKLWMKLVVLGAVIFLLRDTITEYLGRRILLGESLLMDGSARKRLVMWDFALGLFRDSPFFGIGPLNYLQASMGTKAQAISAHNYYINLLAETGILGLGAYLAMLATIFLRGIRTVKRLADRHQKRLAFGLMAGLLAYQFALFFAGGRLTHNNVIYIHSMFWLVVGLLWVMPVVEKNSCWEEYEDEVRDS